MSPLPTKNKKIAIIVSILLIAGSLGYLAFGNFGENIVYFLYTGNVRKKSSGRWHGREGQLENTAGTGGADL